MLRLETCYRHTATELKGIRLKKKTGRTPFRILVSNEIENRDAKFSGCIIRNLVSINANCTHT